jgi:hypothetical protein
MRRVPQSWLTDAKGIIRFLNDRECHLRFLYRETRDRNGHQKEKAESVANLGPVKDKSVTWIRNPNYEEQVEVYSSWIFRFERSKADIHTKSLIVFQLLLLYNY